MKASIVAVLGLSVSAVFADPPDGWQLVDGVYSPIREEVTTYPTMNANESVYVGPGTNVTLSAAQSITNAKQGDTATFVGCTLTSTANLIVKGNDSKVDFDNATVSSEGTLEMNNSSGKPTGATEVRFVNGTQAYFAKGVWWQTGNAPTAARMVVSNSTFTADANRANIAVGAVKTEPGSVCDFAIEIERDGVMKTPGFTGTGNADSHYLRVRQGGRYESTGGFTWSTVDGVNASVICENGGRLVQSGGALIANTGAKLVFDLVSPADEEDATTAVFSKLAGDYAKFNDGFLGEIHVGKKAVGTYKLMEVMGHPTDAKRGVTGIETFKQNIAVACVGRATCETRWETVGSGAATRYELYATVKQHSGLCIVVR